MSLNKSECNKVKSSFIRRVKIISFGLMHELINDISVSRLATGVQFDGEDITKYILSYKDRIKLEVIDYGAIITALHLPDRDGLVENVCIGLDKPEEYLIDNPYFGAIVGRYANRIKDGRFMLNDEYYQLERNNGPHHLHGGLNGFSHKKWKSEIMPYENGAAVKFQLFSPHLDENYPGNLNVELVYAVNKQSEWIVEINAVSDRDTIFNMTQHSYFNLSGNFDGDIFDHKFYIDADHYLPVDATMIPTGTLQKVDNSPFDLRTERSIADLLQAKSDPQLNLASGFDHCFTLNRNDVDHISASAYHKDSGRRMTLKTNLPGMQFYTANTLSDFKSNSSKAYADHSAFCFETQHFPDAPNQSHFPSAVIKANEAIAYKTVFGFSVE